MERVDQLTAPPVPGRFYLVPTVRADVAGVTADWPVIGPKHNDRKDFNVPEMHYHFDARFMSRTLQRRAFLGDIDPEDPACWALLRVHASIITGTFSMDGTGRAIAPVKWLKRRCVFASLPYPWGDQEKVQKLRARWAGKQASPSAHGGWICPHRKVDLSAMPADEAGVITCPLHGLRIDAATGKCMPQHVHGPRAGACQDEAGDVIEGPF